MSSKEQYKDALKRNKELIRTLITRNEILERENNTLRQLNHQLKNQLSDLPKNYKLKKWWQFWK